MALQVIVAVYGGLRGGDPDGTEAAIVTDQLQLAINNSPGGRVTIDNVTLGLDPAPGVQKHFGAIVAVDNQPRPFACVEGQEIDFS